MPILVCVLFKFDVPNYLCRCLSALLSRGSGVKMISQQGGQGQKSKCYTIVVGKLVTLCRRVASDPWRQPWQLFSIPLYLCKPIHIM